ncbi:hypothetical protein CJ739_1832 [Mariniflexile rhizosphaerae]|uniref:hypothetical protein n=1 Tax=unclassified Mariniflexile TaxID=2643887 RepID=UPI000E32D9A5|nr:hypothetical protein [Mariniflexile sp. TRM1-10]AXP80917.1 hypothetical protein CJ739_1832 [Mariniflexile sp. TRM1-10]
MTTYKERIKDKTNFVLIKNDVVLGTFGNLKKITDFVEDENFPSYWTLVRKDEYPIEFEDYRIFKVKHY